MSSASDFVIENGVLKKYVGPGGEVVIPDDVTEIGTEAFCLCTSLTSIVIPDGVSVISWKAFKKCRGLMSVTIPESVAIIRDLAFYGCSSLISVSIPNGVKSIWKEAFSMCTSLTSVTIPNSVTSIESYAFYGCSSLSSVAIPESVATIGDNAFDSTTHIQIVDIWRLPVPLRPNAAVGFAENGRRKETDSFENHIKYIKTNAAKLVKIAIAEPALLSLMCQEKLITPKNVDIYVDAAQSSGNSEMIAMMLDYQANKVSSKQKEGIEKRKEKEEDIITARVAARTGKEEIDGLNIAVAGRLKTFENRDELEMFLHEKGSQLVSSVTANVDYLILTDSDPNNIKAKKARELGIEIISEGFFNELVKRAFSMDGTTLVKYQGKGGDVAIPAGTERIEGEAFRDCCSLTSVIIPDSVQSIGYSAFYGCSNLICVSIPDGVTGIGGWTFYRCSCLTRIRIPASVQTIQEKAFANCPNLTIHAPAGSYAEQYARENNIPFVAE